MNISVQHHTATRSHQFGQAVTVEHLARWADMAATSLVEEMSERLGDYWSMQSHTVDYPVVRGRQCAVMQMVGVADLLEDDDGGWDEDDEDGPVPAPVPAGGAGRKVRERAGGAKAGREGFGCGRAACPACGPDAAGRN